MYIVRKSNADKSHAHLVTYVLTLADEFRGPLVKGRFVQWTHDGI